LFTRAAVTVVSCVSLAAQIQAPQRKIEKNVIISEREPKIRIELPQSTRYVGADRWVLYGIADCELHAFVETDEQKNVRRLYWVQFEGYLPSRPDLKHTYDSPQHATMGGVDFYVDTWVRPKDATIDPDSDREHIEALIKAKGYKMPAGMMYVRFVHLLDDSKRKELMIIYGEDLAFTGHTAGELHEGGRAYARWPAIAESLVSRAEKEIMIEDSQP
jgi:hypothetical protein